MGKLERIAAELGTTGAALVAIPTDVTREPDCRALVKAAIDAFGRVDVLINNAGYAPPASLHDTTEELWDATVDVCLKGVYLMTRATLPSMLANGGGAIVNISSVAGKAGFTNRTAYCAAKWGVHGFTAALKMNWPVKTLGSTSSVPVQSTRRGGAPPTTHNRRRFSIK